MASTVIVNGQTVVHKDSGGQVVTVDVCLTPMGPSMVPVPYVNIAKSADTTNGSKKLAVDGNEIMLKDSKFAVSAGDSPGKAGVASGTVKGWAKFTNYSNDTFIEGKPVCRRMDPMISNNGNTPPAPLMQPNNSVGDVKAEDAFSLSVAFVYEYPDAKGFCRQPEFDDRYTLSGPETFRGPEKSYKGGVHLSTKKDGEYKMKFDPFESEEI